MLLFMAGLENLEILENYGVDVIMVIMAMLVILVSLASLASLAKLVVLVMLVMLVMFVKRVVLVVLEVEGVAVVVGVRVVVVRRLPAGAERRRDVSGHPVGGARGECRSWSAEPQSRFSPP